MKRSQKGTKPSAITHSLLSHPTPLRRDPGSQWWILLFFSFSHLEFTVVTLGLGLNPPGLPLSVKGLLVVHLAKGRGGQGQQHQHAQHSLHGCDEGGGGEKRSIGGKRRRREEERVSSRMFDDVANDFDWWIFFCLCVFVLFLFCFVFFLLLLLLLFSQRH